MKIQAADGSQNAYWTLLAPLLDADSDLVDCIPLAPLDILPQLFWHKLGSMDAANAQIGVWLGLRSPATEGEILRIVEGRLVLE